MSSVLEVRSLGISTTAGVPIVTDVSFRIEAGRAVGLVGESGSGKSLTGLACLGLLPRGVEVASGEISVGGEVVASPTMNKRRRRKRVAMIFQNPMTSLNPVMRIGDQIDEALRRNRSSARRGFSSAIELLELVDIPEPQRRARQWPHELSGGQRQRAIIAIALACNSETLIADEPTTALDVTTQASIVRLIDKLRAELGVSVLFISHDLALVSNVCEDLMVMYAGQIVETGRTADLVSRPGHPYLQGLIDCIPRAEAGELLPMPGRIPLPGEYPAGCRFAPRCGLVTEKCMEPQDMRPAGEDRRARCVHSDQQLQVRHLSPLGGAAE